MTKSFFTVRLSKSAAKELKPHIEKVIPQESRKMSIRARTFDSASGNAGDNIVGYIFEFIQNKDVCYTFAAIVIAWIRSRHGKSITFKKGDTKIEVKGLNGQELYKILESKDVSIEIDCNDKDKLS